MVTGRGTTVILAAAACSGVKSADVSVIIRIAIYTVLQFKENLCDANLLRKNDIEKLSCAGYQRVYAKIIWIVPGIVKVSTMLSAEANGLHYFIENGYSEKWV